MIKRNIYLFFLVLTVLNTGCGKQKLPDLRESYSRLETKPFGARVAFDILQNSFLENYVQPVKQRFEKNMLASPDTSSLYFCITRNFFTTATEADAILDYVYRGNTFFLAAADIDSLLLNKIYCSVANPGFSEIPFYEKTSVRLVEEVNFAQDTFSYFYRPFTSYFSGLNNNYCRSIGYNENGKVNYLVFFWGKGKLFLHTDPRAFSNYFLLRNNNYEYMQALLQLLDERPAHIYWSDFYWRQNYRSSGKSFSTLDEIFKQPALKAAFWLSLLLLLLYLFFGSKRKQRVIKNILPNENSSVAFTETIARLYLQKKDNKNIADKMITHFNEYLRTNFFLYAHSGSREFIEGLSRKSGVSLEKTTSLYYAIDHANRSERLDDYQLLSLNEQIGEFYKTRK